jgi:hypothetical protein
VRSTAAAGLAAGLATLLLILVSVERTTASDPSGPAYVRTFDDARDPLEATLATGDGQAYAALARDPAMARPEVFYGGAREAAYRAQRPLAAYAAWLVAAGRPAMVPVALVVVAVVSAAGAAMALASLLRRRGVAAPLGAVVAILPPTLATAQWIGPDLLGVALVTAGVAAWPTRPRPAAACFAGAGLARESLLLVPLVAAAHALVRRERRAAALAALAVTPWMAWVAVVRWRLGYWPWAASGGRLGGPLTGIVDAVPRWASPADELACILLAGAFVAVALRRQRDLAALVVIAYAGFAMIMGTNVWLRWQDFVRPLAPLYVLGVVVAVARPRRTSANAAGTNAAIGTAHTALQ